MISYITAFFTSASTWLSSAFSWLASWKTEIMLFLAHRRGKAEGKKDAQFKEMERQLNDIDKVNNALNDDEFLNWVREQQRAEHHSADD